MAMTEIASRVAENIQILLDRLSMSQTTLAETSGLNRSTIQEIISHRTTPNIQTLDQIAKALDVQPETLLKSGLEKVKLTGIKKIDTAIAEINNNLYKGPEAKKTIGKYFTPDYKIKYAEIELGDPLREGPDLDEELKLNFVGNGEDRGSFIRSAWITGNQVHTLLEVRKNATFDKNSVAAALRADAHFHISEVIDTWMMENLVEQIQHDNAPVKIKRRLLKYLNEKIE
jgi:transcriptional regulator with XRE-family HTH domain